MDIERLKEFVCLAETLNYRMAANRCYIDQSTLSRHITSLEKALGCKLLERTKANVSLTPFGEILLEHASTILHEYDTCLREINRSRDTEQNSLLVGYTHAAAHRVLSEFYIFIRTQREYDSLGLNFKQLQFDSIKANLDNDTVDAIIDVEPDYDESTYGRFPIYSDRLVAIVPPSHPLAKLSSVTPDELCGQTLLVPKLPIKSFQSSFMQKAFGLDFLDKVKLKPAYSAATEIPWFVSSGAGIAVAGGFVFQDANARNLVCIPIEGTNTSYNVCVIWKAQKESAALRDCIAALTKLMKSETFRSCLPTTAREPI